MADLRTQEISINTYRAMFVNAGLKNFEKETDENIEKMVSEIIFSAFSNYPQSSTSNQPLFSIPEALFLAENIYTKETVELFQGAIDVMAPMLKEKARKEKQEKLRLLNQETTFLALELQKEEEKENQINSNKTYVVSPKSPKNTRKTEQQTSFSDQSKKEGIFTNFKKLFKK